MGLDLVCPILKKELKENAEKEFEVEQKDIVVLHKKSNCTKCNGTCFIEKEEK